MALDRTLLVRLYVNRLVNSLVPAEVGAEYAHSLANDLVEQLSQPCSPETLSKSLDEVKTLLLSQNRSTDWLQFRQVIDALARDKSPDQISNYLLFLREFVPEPPTFPNRLSHPANTTRIGVPMARLLPHTDSIPEEQIILYLQYTLLGQDTKLLVFNGDSILIPDSIDNTHARILSDIIEPALVYRRVGRFLEESKGVAASPIKVAFYRCVESALIAYTSHVNRLFQTPPSSLIAVYTNIKEQTHMLHVYLHLLRQSSTLTGYEFLVHVDKLAKFGDTQVQKIAAGIFSAIVVPYYEYLEQWVICGELVDEHNDFFVSFNASKDHINDIVVFDAAKLPTFLGMDTSVFTNVLHIGKTLIFLGKFCKELEWVNNYAAKYSQMVFHVHGGLKSMSSSDIHNLFVEQYHEVMVFFTHVVHSKNHLYLHLVMMKAVMLMAQSDFVEVLGEKGASMFSEPASALTSGRLSDLLILSMEALTMRTLPHQYLHRIDARILDLNHGSTGWDVFTLEYKLDVPIETLLNYGGASTQYLRLFHFLWSLQHHVRLLQDIHLEFQSLHRTMAKDPWLQKAVRLVSIVRSRLLAVVRVLLRHLSYDMVEQTFYEKVVQVLFRSAHKRTMPNQALEAAFSSSTSNMLPFNVNLCTIDDITTMHTSYLEAISRCKILNENVTGRSSGKSLIGQVFDFLDMSSAFVQSSQEFAAAAVNYTNLINVEDMASDLTHARTRLRDLVKIIYRDIYMGRFEPSMAAFVRDLRADSDLKELSRLF